MRAHLHEPDGEVHRDEVGDGLLRSRPKPLILARVGQVDGLAGALHENVACVLMSEDRQVAEVLC